ncbi:MAG: cupin domain-containing protein [Solirubrobacteraceae bacterium]
MTVICHDQARRTETPNAVMTTLASPTVGGAGRSLWRVEMSPGVAGPSHRFDVEQIWTALGGAATVELDGDRHALVPGDTIVIAPGLPRRVIADQTEGFSAIVTAAPEARAAMLDGTDRGVPAWIA